MKWISLVVESIHVSHKKDIFSTCYEISLLTVNDTVLISRKLSNQNKLRSVERISLTPKMRSVLSSPLWNHNPNSDPENCDFSLRSGPVLSSAPFAERSELSAGALGPNELFGLNERSVFERTFMSSK